MEIGFFIAFFITFLIGNLFFYVIGNVFFNIISCYLNFKNPNNSLKFGLSIILGFLFSSSVVACLKTNLDSILIYQFLIFFSLLIFGIYKKSININFKINQKIITYTFINYLAFLFLFSLKNNNFHYDFIYWGKLSKSIYSIGIESLDSLFGVFIVSKKTMLYHYGDYWITGFITSITKNPEIYTLIYVVYPIMISSIIITISGISENKFKNSILNYLFALGILFGTKLFIGTSNEVLNPLLHTYRGLYEASQLKTVILFLPIILSFYFYKKSNQIISLLFLSITPFLYPTTTICITISFLFLVFIYLIDGNKTIKNKLILIFLTLTYCIYTIFLKIKSSNPHLKLEIEIKSFKYYFIQFIELNYKLFFEAIIPLLIIISHLIINHYKKTALIRTSNFVFSISIYLGIIGSMLFVNIHKPFVDNNQIINNITPVFLTILFLELILMIESKKMMTVSLIIFNLTIIYNYIYSNIEFDTKYKNNLNLDFSESFKTNSINKIKKLKNINSIYFSNKIHQDYSYIPGNKFDYLSKEYNFDLPFMMTSKSFYIGDSSFIINKKLINFENKNELRNFIIKYKINTIFTESKWNFYLFKKLIKEKIKFDVMIEESTNSRIFFIKN